LTLAENTSGFGVLNAIDLELDKRAVGVGREAIDLELVMRGRGVARVADVDEREMRDVCTVRGVSLASAAKEPE